MSVPSKVKAVVSLNAESVVLDEEQGVFTISLAHCQMLQYDAMAGKLTFAVRKDEVIEEASRGIEKQSQDHYIGQALEIILNDS